MTYEGAWYNVKQGKSIPHKKETLAKIRELVEQKPCEDAVNRQAFEEIKEIMTDISGNSVYAVRMSNIRALPSVQPKAKIGHWIVSTDCEGKTRQCTCDLCGYETGKHTWKNPNFCEDCGAKMEEIEKNAVPEHVKNDEVWNYIVPCLNMREATPEEQKAVEKYLKKISKSTGENFWDLIAESEAEDD